MNSWTAAGLSDWGHGVGWVQSGVTCELVWKDFFFSIPIPLLFLLFFSISLSLPSSPLPLCMCVCVSLSLSLSFFLSFSWWWWWWWWCIWLYAEKRVGRNRVKNFPQGRQLRRRRRWACDVSADPSTRQDVCDTYLSRLWPGDSRHLLSSVSFLDI